MAVGKRRQTALQAGDVERGHLQRIPVGVAVVGEQARRGDRQGPADMHRIGILYRHRSGIADMDERRGGRIATESIVDRVGERRVADEASVGREGEAAVRAWADHALARQAGDVEDRHAEGIAVGILVVGQQARRGHRQYAAGMDEIFVGVRVRCVVGRNQGESRRDCSGKSACAKGTGIR